ncbi:tetratricopeptide repeat protein [Gimesia sp.]|uniref:tetratricopeptide repeat protein n=1 Tax=Gimesia sp. TaxID=2024833 RepID=UPI003A901892
MTDHRLKSPASQSFKVILSVTTLVLSLQSFASAAPQQMTPQELQAFGKQIQDTAAAQDPAKFRALFDWKTFINRVLSEYEQNAAVKQAIQPVRQQLEAAYTGENRGIDSEILTEVANGADYRFLAMRKEDGQYKVIFRFLRPDWTLNYQALIIEKQESGELKIIDIDSLSTGELISQSLQRVYLPELYKAHGANQDKLTPEEKTRILDQKKRYDLLTAADEKADPFQAYSQLPTQYKSDKTVLLFLAQDAIAKEDRKKYQQVLNVYRKYHPQDPAAELLSIDYFSIEKQYSQAIDSLERLSASLKTVDPYLYSLRAGILIEMGDINLAGKYAGKASEIEPDLLQPYLHLLNISVMQGNFDETIRHLETLKSKFGFAYEDLDLSELENIEKFTSSPQFKKWQSEKLPPKAE